MGTRHLISAITGGQTKLAQYGQWDGYPSGQGVEILAFLRTLAAERGLRTHFISRLEKCSFVDDGGDANNRDLGAKVLTMIMQSHAGLKLIDMSDFAKDTLFCEWVYIIDFDANELRVTNGGDATFSLDALPTDEEFCKAMGE